MDSRLSYRTHEPFGLSAIIKSAESVDNKSLGLGGSYNGNIREEPAKSLRSAADYDYVHLQGLVCGVNCEVGEDPCVV